MEKKELTQGFDKLVIDSSRSERTESAFLSIPNLKLLVLDSSESERTGSTSPSTCNPTEKKKRSVSDRPETKNQIPKLSCRTRLRERNTKFFDFKPFDKEEIMKLDFVVNEYEKAESCKDLIKCDTAVVYDNNMTLHKCEWDSNYLENPNRYWTIIKRCDELGLLDRCLRIPYEPARKEHVTKVHDEEIYEKLKMISSKSNLEEIETNASDYDSIYFNEKTFNAAMIAAGCAISLVEAICKGQVQNGMAIVRPPGHHAMSNEYCGFCYFNNVAIAAQHALDNGLAKKILIVDFDVHHGQATQQMFYESDKVLYFSIHRYQHGSFWPNLRESNFDHIGQGNGVGYNINFPLNATGLTDSDYLSIIFQILLPVAYEFNPDLILVSAGYDACIGCPEGEMDVTPMFYGHLITLLSGLAMGRIAVCLEGGYFLPSLAEGVAFTIKALLGDPCGTLEPLTVPHATTIETINDLRTVLYESWTCFHLFDSKNIDNHHQIKIKFEGKPPERPFPTRNCYPGNSIERVQKYTDLTKKYQFECKRIGCNQIVACCYDEAMLLHNCNTEQRVESPSRLLAIQNTYLEWFLDARCLNISPKSCNLDILKEVHDADYINLIMQQNFKLLISKHRDMFSNENTFVALIKATESMVALVDTVLTGGARSGVALIRPPGHHAESDNASGFCFINNVAVAAKYILKKYKLQKIVIIDFDIHHGNGTQKIFYDDDKVLYISIHKYFPKSFFPFSTEGNYNYCGGGNAAGYNVNVAVAASDLHDVDYLTIFFSVILPIVYSFGPDIILVSAGFDAGINDPLGHYHVTPECFGQFIKLLKPLANGNIILALEGGYNPTTVQYAMNICIKTLLGDPLPLPSDVQGKIKPKCKEAIINVKEAHKKYWPILDIDKKPSSRFKEAQRPRTRAQIQHQPPGCIYH